MFGEVTTGASNDLEKVTATAKQMVMRFGMSEKLGPRVFGHDHGQPFLGREFSSEPDYSDDVAREIDAEIRRIVEEAHQMARSILEQHRDNLDKTSDSGVPCSSDSNSAFSIVSRRTRISEIVSSDGRCSVRMSFACWCAPSTMRLISSSISRAISSE